MYVEELFPLAGSAAGELAKTAFAEADSQARDVPGLPLVVLRAAAEAADKVGNRARAEHYQEARRCRATAHRHHDGPPMRRHIPSPVLDSRAHSPLRQVWSGRRRSRRSRAPSASNTSTGTL